MGAFSACNIEKLGIGQTRLLLVSLDSSQNWEKEWEAHVDKEYVSGCRKPNACLLVAKDSPREFT